jgi:hypothetical protein
MTRRSRIWMVLAVLFLVVNAGGAAFAAAAGELRHGALHVALLLPGVLLLRWLAARRSSSYLEQGGGAETSMAGEISDRLTHLEQSLDAAAIEIERVGEGQRFMTRFFSEKGIPRRPREGGAEPVERESAENGPDGSR